MTPIYKKVFDSPLLAELNTLAQKEWMLLNSIDLTKEEFQELWDIFHDPEYHKDKFHPDHDMDLHYAKVTITVDGMNGIEYVNQMVKPEKPKGWIKW